VRRADAAGLQSLHSYVLDRQKNEAARAGNSGGVEQHDARPDAAEVVLNLDIGHPFLAWEHILQGAPEGRKIPLTVAQFIEEPAFGLGRQQIKRIAERSVAFLPSQVA